MHTAEDCAATYQRMNIPIHKPAQHEDSSVTLNFRTVGYVGFISQKVSPSLNTHLQLWPFIRYNRLFQWDYTFHKWDFVSTYHWSITSTYGFTVISQQFRMPLSCRLHQQGELLKDLRLTRLAPSVIPWKPQR